MTTLREAAQQALEALRCVDLQSLVPDYGSGHYSVARLDGPQVKSAITAMEAALAEPTVKESLQVELAPEPVKFDHSIGADRFKVMRGAFWWHVLIGDSPTEHGKFRSRASAEKMAADLLREFRNGAFAQHEAALAEPVQRPSDTAFDLWWDDALDGPTPIAPVSKETAQWIWNAANTERVHGIGESNE